MKKKMLLLLTSFIGITLEAIYQWMIGEVSESIGSHAILENIFQGNYSTPTEAWIRFFAIFFFGISFCLLSDWLLRSLLPKRIKKVRQSHKYEKFHNTEVVIDGKCFDRCTFTGVDLVFQGEGRFELKDCIFINSNRIVFTSSIAQLILELEDFRRRNDLGVKFE